MKNKFDRENLINNLIAMLYKDNKPIEKPIVQLIKKKYILIRYIKYL